MRSKQPGQAMIAGCSQWCRSRDLSTARQPLWASGTSSTRAHSTMRNHPVDRLGAQIGIADAHPAPRRFLPWRSEHAVARVAAPCAGKREERPGLRGLPGGEVVAYGEAHAIAFRAAAGEGHPPAAIKARDAAGGDVPVVPGAGERADGRALILPGAQVRGGRVADVLVKVVVLPAPLGTHGLGQLQVKGVPAFAVVGRTSCPTSTCPADDSRCPARAGADSATIRAGKPASAIEMARGIAIISGPSVGPVKPGPPAAT